MRFLGKRMDCNGCEAYRQLAADCETKDSNSFHVFAERSEQDGEKSVSAGLNSVFWNLFQQRSRLRELQLRPCCTCISKQDGGQQMNKSLREIRPPSLDSMIAAHRKNNRKRITTFATGRGEDQKTVAMESTRNTRANRTSKMTASTLAVVRDHDQFRILTCSKNE